MNNKLGLYIISILASILLMSLGGCSRTPNTKTTTSEEAIEVVSVLGPSQPINPGGPIVEITLKNISSESIIALSATLELNKSFVFSYDVSASNPLPTGKSIGVKLSLINAGYDASLSYLLTINGTQQNGETFVYTRQVKITAQ